MLKKIILMVLSVLCFTFCASNHEMQMNFPQDIAKAYYETLAENAEKNAVMVNFYIEFKEPLSDEVLLQKVYFRNQEAVIEKISDKKYVAHFPQIAAVQDIILDSDSRKEYGNKAPIIAKPKFELSKDEAVLEYQMNGDTIFFKLKGINEKQ